MVYVQQPFEYPSPLHVHEATVEAPILTTNRPIAVKNVPVIGICVFGLPDDLQENCFNFLDELVAAANEAHAKSPKVWVQILLHQKKEQARQFLGEWCLAKGHEPPPMGAVASVHNEPNQLIGPSKPKNAKKRKRSALRAERRKLMKMSEAANGEEIGMGEATKEATGEATDKATGEATEEATEKAKGEATEKATEKATEEATKKATEKATEEATEKANGEATKKANEKATEKANGEATEKATEKATEEATEEATKKANEKANEKANGEATGEKANGEIDAMVGQPDEEMAVPVGAANPTSAVPPVPQESNPVTSKTD
jgi:hypothetical protein